jgi:hypothetical protein
MINTQLTPSLPRTKEKKKKILTDVLRVAHRKGDRKTLQPELRTVKATPEASQKEFKTISPIPPLKPDKPAVAPGLEYSGFSKNNIKKYGG